MNITVYHTHTCPKCRILIAKLNSTKLEYTESEDVQFLIDKGFKSAPIMEVDGNYYEYIDALHWIKDWQKDNKEEASL